MNSWKPFLSTLSIALAATLAGCGGSVHEADSNGSTSSGVHTVYWTESINEYANRADVRCPLDRETCALGVGQLYVARGGNSVGICTAFLVEDDLILTNSHCLADGMAAGQSCNGQIVFKLPDAPHSQAFTRQCRTIVARSQVNESSSDRHPDYALLRLESTVSTHTVLRINAARIVTHAEMLTVLRVTPHHGTAGGVVERSSCKVLRTSRSTVTRRNPNPTETLSECPVVSGNSGSPALDNHGHVVGIISMGSRPDSLLQNLGAMTAMACVSPFTATQIAPSSCRI